MKTSTDRRYLTDPAGRPVLIWGEGAWTLNSQLRTAQQDAYLQDRASRGITAIGLQLISRYQDNSPADADAVVPFTSAGDFATFNPAYFAKASDLVRRAGERGIRVFIAPCWSGYDAAQGFYDVMVANGAAKSRAYGAAVANVFKDFDNIVWVLGGDKPGDFSSSEIEAMAEGIRSVDSRHLFTAHWNFVPSDQRPGPWQDITSCYDWANGTAYQQVEREYAEADAPVILLEGLYELNSSYGATAHVLRLQSIMALLSGAKGSFFGHEGVWHLGASRNLPQQSQGHPYDLNSEGMRHQQNIRHFFVSRAWHDLVPDTTSALVVGGRGQHGSTEYVGAARTRDRTLGVAYLPRGGTIHVSMAAMSLPARARWFDPTNGSYTDGATYSAAGTVQLAAPPTNSAGEQDWLLAIESTGGTTPTAVPATKPAVATLLALALAAAGVLRARQRPRALSSCPTPTSGTRPKAPSRTGKPPSCTA